jgi:prepilin-type N-terminal cleavage/methylation domain-containing protein
MPTNKTKAFTLIELLIVIAIILILIAIALPNFLEAQVRAKVTKAQGEMRSLATAIEAYQTDWKTYPADGDDIFPLNPANYNVFARLTVLTTPVKLIESLPFDPFNGDNSTFGPSEMALFPGLPPYTYAYNTFGAYQTDGFQPANGGKPDNYGLTSLGPNMKFDAGFSGPIQYSPTNGSKSVGDILRLGGRRTPLSPP